MSREFSEFFELTPEAFLEECSKLDYASRKRLRKALAVEDARLALDAANLRVEMLSGMGGEASVVAAVAKAKSKKIAAERRYAKLKNRP